MTPSIPAPARGADRRRPHRTARRIALAGACGAALVTLSAGAATAAPQAGDGGSAAARAARTVSAFDREFVASMMQRSKADIIAGGIAQQRSPSVLGRETGSAAAAVATVVRTQTGMLAKSLGVIPPTTTSPSQHWSLHQLGELMGVEFDRQYAQLLLAHQVEAVREAELELKSGANTRIKAFAQMLLPTLRAQLAMARRLAANPG